MTSPSPQITKSPLPRRVLLVEDDEAAGRGLAKLLTSQGFEVQTVRDGETAIQSLSTGIPPDFLLTDLQLPDLDGREIARHSLQLVPRPKVALITGWDLESLVGDPDLCGIDWVLMKPVDFRDLVTKMRSVPDSLPNVDKLHP